MPSRIFVLPEPTVRKNTRSTIRQDIERHWLNQQTSNIGIQGVYLENGLIRAARCFGRSDLLWMHYEDCCNVFIDNFEHWQIDHFTGVILNNIDEGNIAARVRKEQSIHYAYLQRELRFLEQRVWLICDGLTPAQAVDTLLNNGW